MDEAHDFLQAHVRKCARCHLKLRCKLSARKVRHDCTQNISKEYSNKQWSLDATVPQKRRTLLYCDQCTELGKPLQSQHDFCKTNTLLFTEKHLLRLFYTRRVSDLHASPATRKATHTLRACSHWEPVTHPAWFLQNKLSIIHGIQYTKIIQHFQSLIYTRCGQNTRKAMHWPG